MSTNDKTRTCPQCDGAGQEDTYAMPIVCRKCGGSGGAPAMARVASILCGGEALEKRAQQEFDEIFEPSDLADDPIGSFDDLVKGTGFDPLAFVPSETTDHELRMEIVSMLGSLPEEDKTRLFERILSIMGSNADEARRGVSGPDGTKNGGMVEEFIYKTIDAMDRSKLVAVYSAIRQLV